MEETEHRTDSDSDEINLYSLFQVIWKRKSLIIVIFLISVIAAGIISYTSPSVYRVTATVSPGWISPDVAGKAINVDSAVNIKSLIEGGAFNIKIMGALKLDPGLYSRMEFKTKLAKNTEAVSVFYDDKDTEKGKIIMGELLKELKDYYKVRTETRSATIDNSIIIMKNQNEIIESRKMQNINSKARIVNQKKRILNEKKRIMDYMELLKDKIEVLKVTGNNLMNQLKGVDENSKVIMKGRNEMLKKDEKADSVALLLYSTTIQQNISYINNLNADVQRTKLEQESTKNELSKKELELKDKDTELNDADTALKDLDSALKDFDTEILNNLARIQNLELQNKRIEGLKLIQEPYASIKPVAPRKIFNMASAGVTALFFGIFLVFVLEFIRKAKKTPRDL